MEHNRDTFRACIHQFAAHVHGCLYIQATCRVLRNECLGHSVELSANDETLLVTAGHRHCTRFDGFNTHIEVTHNPLCCCRGLVPFDDSATRPGSFEEVVLDE